MRMRYVVAPLAVALSIAVVSPLEAVAAEASTPAVQSAPALSPDAAQGQPLGGPLAPVLGLLGGVPIIGGLLGGPH